MSAKKLFPDLYCPQKKCSGVLWDVTPGLAAHMGVLHYKCDKCGHKFAKKVSQP